MEALDAAAVELHVVGAPADAELFAARRQFTGQVGQPPVVGVAAGLDAKDGDDVVGDGVPVVEKPVARGPGT